MVEIKIKYEQSCIARILILLTFISILNGYNLTGINFTLQNTFIHPGNGSDRYSQAFVISDKYIYIGTNAGIIRKYNYETFALIGDFPSINGTKQITGLYYSNSSSILYAYYYNNSCFRMWYQNFTVASQYYLSSQYNKVEYSQSQSKAYCSYYESGYGFIMRNMSNPAIIITSNIFSGTPLFFSPIYSKNFSKIVIRNSKNLLTLYNNIGTIPWVSYSSGPTGNPDYDTTNLFFQPSEVKGFKLENQNCISEINLNNTVGLIKKTCINGLTYTNLTGIGILNSDGPVMIVSTSGQIIMFDKVSSNYTIWSTNVDVKVNIKLTQTKTHMFRIGQQTSVYSISCSGGLYYQSVVADCISSCLTGQYLDSIKLICYPCNILCATCSNTTGNCLTCFSGYSLANGTCITNCLVGQFLNSSDMLCYNCSTLCATCSNTTGSCLTCFSGYSLANGTCITNCLVGQFLNSSDMLCYNCSTLCATCSNTTGSCLTCFSGYSLANGTCLINCLVGQFLNSSDMLCYNCSTLCATCSNTTGSCLTCFSGYSLSNGTCLINCLVGQFLNSSDMLCYNCSTLCATCSNTTGSCLTCFSGYFLSNGTCLINCLVGQFLNSSDMLCYNCSTLCATCSNTTGSCLTCFSGYSLANGTCITNCLVGQFLNSSDMLCYNCSTLCATCSNTTGSCLTCISGYFQYLGKCEVCHINCLSCEVIFSNCTSCKIGFILNTNTSICDLNLTFCAELQYFNTPQSKCLPCSKLCSKCEFYSGLCTQCIIGYFYFLNQCIPCQRNCKACSMISNNCTSCDNTFILIQNNCVISSQIVKVGQIAISLTAMVKAPIIKWLFLCSDELWLYTYGKYNYTGNIQDVFDTISFLQSVKWQFLSFGKNINIDENIFKVSDYSSYSNEKHLEVERVDDCFLKNIYQYLFYTIPESIIAFLICRKIFYMLFNYRISINFRKFSFYGFMILMLFEQNIQYFTYLACNNLKIMFSFKFMDKIQHILCCLIFFVIVIFAFNFYLLIRYEYNKLSFYFVQKMTPTFQTFLNLTFLIGGKNFIIGILHSFLSQYYLIQIICLGLVHAIVAIFILYFIVKYQGYVIISFAFTILFNSILLVLFNILLIVQYQIVNADTLWKQIMNEVTNTMIILFIANTILQIFTSFITKDNEQHESEISSTFSGLIQNNSQVQIENKKEQIKEKNQDTPQNKAKNGEKKQFLKVENFGIYQNISKMPKQVNFNINTKIQQKQKENRLLILKKTPDGKYQLYF